MRLYTSKKEAEILIKTINKEVYRSTDPETIFILARLSKRIVLCLELQESEEKAGVSNEIQK